MFEQKELLTVFLNGLGVEALRMTVDNVLPEMTALELPGASAPYAVTECVIDSAGWLSGTFHVLVARHSELGDVDESTVQTIKVPARFPPHTVTAVVETLPKPGNK